MAKEINLLASVSPYAPTGTVKITNFASLKNVKIKVADETKATGALASDTITFTAVAVGNTTCDITADDAVTKKITINVTAPAQIEVDKETVDLTVEA